MKFAERFASAVGARFEAGADNLLAADVVVITTSVLSSSIHPIGDVFDRVFIEGSVQVLGDVSYVRRCKHVIKMSKGMVFRQWFMIENVESGASYLARLQGVDQGAFVDDRTSGGIDQSRRRPHQAQLLSTDQASGSIAEHKMNGQQIRLLK